MLNRLMWEILRPILIGQRKSIKLLFEDNKAGVTAMVAGMTDPWPDDALYIDDIERVGVGGRGVPDANGFTTGRSNKAQIMK